MVEFLTEGLAIALTAQNLTNLNFMDVMIMFFAGLLGHLMKRYGFPITPLILALVLGYTIEDNFRKALVLSDGSPFIFLKSPVSLIFLLLAVVMLLAPIVKPWLAKRSKANA